jgi:protein LSM14
METVERALGDLRIDQQQGGRGGRRNRDLRTGDLRVPATDFDFQSSNARFDKSSVAPAKPNKEKENSRDDDTPAEGSEDGELKEKEEEEEDAAYNPKKSFFDSLSSSASGPTQNGGQGAGRGRGRGGRSRREEEREKNVATFGEPGGIGLMGPGAYVGGYGRRGGGGRGRRGGGANGVPR